MGQSLVVLCHSSKTRRNVELLALPTHKHSHLLVDHTELQPVAANTSLGPVYLARGSIEATADMSDVPLFPLPKNSESPYRDFQLTTNGYTKMHFRQSKALYSPKPNSTDTELFVGGPTIEMLAQCSLGRTGPSTALSDSNWTIGIFQTVDQGSGVSVGYSSSLSTDDNFSSAFRLVLAEPLPRSEPPILDCIAKNNSKMPAYNSHASSSFSLADVYKTQKSGESVTGTISMADQPLVKAQVCIKQGDKAYGAWLEENNQKDACYYLHYIQTDAKLTTWVCCYNTETKEMYPLRAVKWSFNYTVQLKSVSGSGSSLKLTYDFSDVKNPQPISLPRSQLPPFPRQVLEYRSDDDKTFCLANESKFVATLPRSSSK